MSTIERLMQQIARFASAIASSSNDGIGWRPWMRICVQWEVLRVTKLPVTEGFSLVYNITGIE